MREYFEAHEESILDEFFTFLRFKSISAETEYRSDCLACCEWLKKFLNEIGMTTTLFETSTLPALYAEDLSAGPSKPTLLLYNHYDVQPIDPLALWKYPPFEPTLEGETLFARGAQDNKGQCFYVLMALKAYKKRFNSFPINIKVIIEGDEEMGSVGLKEIVHTLPLKADYLLVTDLDIQTLDSPAITLGTRGLLTMELHLTGSATDLHSGGLGGIVYNPLHALVEMLSKVRNDKGEILIPGFYNGVQMASDSIDLSFNPDEFHKQFGSHPTGGERAFSPFERAWLRPTFEINGLSGGYAGEGFKTVIPKEASAKLSCRLVPGQDPNLIFNHTKTFFEAIKPEGMTLELRELKSGSQAVRTEADSPLAKAVKQAYEESFEQPCRHILSGGTIGIAGPLQQASEASILFHGLGLPTDQIHAPNEHFSLPRLKKGMAIIGRIISLLGDLK